jgi:hypothetical protein
MYGETIKSLADSKENMMTEDILEWFAQNTSPENKDKIESTLEI